MHVIFEEFYSYARTCKINSIKLRCLVHPSYNKNSATSVTSVTEREKEGEMEILNSKQII